MRVLREEVTPAEQTNLQQLSAMWEERNLQPVPGKQRWHIPGRQFLYPAAGIAAALLLALGLGWSFLAPAPSQSAQIAQALVESVRPFEPRVVGQPYRAIQEVTRSVEEVDEDVLAAQMTEESAESYAAGRYFLMRRNYTQAIKYLKKTVEESKGVPADVHNDLGVAYLQSAELKGAEAEFKEALLRKPAHMPAVFNLSILYERAGRLDEARQQRQEYLRLDPYSGWAKEVEKKLSGKE
jgi:tetratricopeptide (TPR) repeat protein